MTEAQRMSLPYFYFKSKCSHDFGLFVRQKNAYDGAERDVDFEKVAGRSGDLIVDNGSYNNISIAYDMKMLNDTGFTFQEVTKQIKYWLLGEQGYFQLFDSYDLDYFRLASFVGEVSIEQEYSDTGAIEIEFSCKPFRYSFDGQNIVTLTEIGTVNNPEFFASKPYIKIYGNGEITLSINDKSWKFTDVEEYIEIDSEIMNAFKGVEPLNHKMTGDYFPELKAGENTISWVGEVEKVEIIPRWCCL